MFFYNDQPIVLHHSNSFTSYVTSVVSTIRNRIFPLSPLPIYTVIHSITQALAGYELAIYYNTDNAKLTASWMVDNTHYCITGAISEDEITSILKSMMN